MTVAYRRMQARENLLRAAKRQPNPTPELAWAIQEYEAARDVAARSIVAEGIAMMGKADL